MLQTCISCLENITAEAKITFQLSMGILLLLIVCQNLMHFYSAYGRGAATSYCGEMTVFEQGRTAPSHWKGNCSEAEFGGLSLTLFPLSSCSCPLPKGQPPGHSLRSCHTASMLPRPGRA